MMLRRSFIIGAAATLPRPWVRPVGLFRTGGAGTAAPPFTSSIGLLGPPTRTFATTDEWVAAVNTLPSIPSGTPYTGVHYNDGEQNFTSGLTFTSNTSAWNGTGQAAIVITTAAGQSFRDNPSVRSNPLAYNAANGVGLNFNVSDLSHNYGIAFGVLNVAISNMQILLRNGNVVINSDPGGAVFGTLSAYIDNCILHDQVGGRAWTTAAGSRMRNSLIICEGANGGGGDGMIFDGATSGAGAELDFCTIVSTSDNLPKLIYGLFATIGEAGSHNTTMKSCALFGAQNLAYLGSGYPITATTCMTDATGAGFTGGLTYANQFNGISSSTADFRVNSGAALIGAGTFDATITTDISGKTRPNPPTVGCWEF